MTKEQKRFIEEVAILVRKYAPQYGIEVHSPIIAQAILESGWGNSELALCARNFFGLKYKEGRCPTASGVYYKKGSEQNADGTYSESEMKWCRFDNMEFCVIGYFDFISHQRYSNLKGVTDPLTYLRNIKSDGYATSIKYVDNVWAVIEKYNLEKYDRVPIIALDAGHGFYTAGKRVTLKGYPDTREWQLNDRIIDIVEEELRNNYICKVLRVDDTTGKKDISLSKRVSMANNANADAYLSMHHNAGVKGGSGGGTVVFYYSSNIKRRDQAQKLYNYITDETRLYGNRSQQVIKKGFYVIKNTKMPAYLCENGFMDSTTDVPRILSEDHAKKTARGVLAFLVEVFDLDPKKAYENDNTKASEASAYYPNYTGNKTTLHNAMTSLGIDASYKHRKEIAKANSIANYIGTASQNTQMYNLLVAGLLKKE